MRGNETFSSFAAAAATTTTTTTTTTITTTTTTTTVTILIILYFVIHASCQQEYTVFGYLRHHWTDKRFAGKFQDPVLLKGTTIERAWLPDTYISNARESNFPQKDSESQSSLLVSPDGGLFYSKG